MNFKQSNDTIERIGVIGDIHTQDILLEKAINHISTPNIYCTGDLVRSYVSAGNIHKVIKLIKDNNIQTVQGNHDEWLKKSDDLSEDEFEFIKSLPKTLEIETSYGPILFCHGIGDNNMAKVNPDDYGYAIEANFELQDIINSRKFKMIINGHSHRKMARDIDGLKIINAGALVHEEKGFLEIDFNKQKVDFFVFNDDEISIDETIAFS